MRIIFLTSVFVLTAVFNAVLPACGEEITTEQLKIKTLGWAIKSSLKVYLQNSDFLQLKHKKTAELNKMNEQTFSIQYAGAWSVLKKCPVLVARYRLAPNASKDHVLKIISGLSLKECLDAVDSIPDEVMVDQFEQCINDPEISDKPLKEQIDSIIGKWFPKT